MKRFLMALGTSFVVMALMVACYLGGILSASALWQSAVLMGLVGALFFVLFACGANLRCADKSLTVPQMLASTAVILHTMYGANGGRAVFVLILLMIFLFGVLQLTIRPLLALAATTLAGYAGVIALLWAWRPQALDLTLELLQWCALAITLPWFAVMGGFISGLRTKLHKRNDELQGLLYRVQDSEAGLAQAQRIAGLGGWTFAPRQRSATWSQETYRLFGVDPARPALTGAAFLRLVHGDERRHYMDVVAPALHAGRAFDAQFRIVRADGAVRWVHALGQPLGGADGHSVLLRGTVMDITRQREQEAALTLAHDAAAAARATLIDAIECLNEAFVLFDADDRLLLCNRNYLCLFNNFGHLDDIAGMHFEDLVRLSLAQGEVIEAAFEGDVARWVSACTRRHRHPDAQPWSRQLGDGRWIEVSEQRTRDGGIVGVWRDISAARQIEQRQAMEHAVTLMLAESATLAMAAPKIIEAMCVSLDWDGGAFWHWDRQAEVLACAESWRRGPAEVAPAPDMARLARRVWMSGEPVWIADLCGEADGRAAEAGWHAAFAVPVTVGAELFGVLALYARALRQPVPAQLAVGASIGAQIGQFIARKGAEEEIRQLAFYDPLTGLPNRRLLSDRLHQALGAAGRSRRHGGLLFIDLDNFKTINDTLGHAKGDLLLQQVGARLAGCVRVGDTVARQGGDEFVIMLLDLSEAQAQAATQVEAIGEQVLQALSRPYQLAGHAYHNSASIGATLFDGQPDSTDELLKRADLAMYQAKAAGRNALRFFETDMQTAVSSRAALEADLRIGLQQGQFLLYYQAQIYQAQIDAGGAVTGAEVLLRWRHPLRGLTSPAEFIPAAEESGLILPLGRWVLETACHQLAAWARGPATAHLNVAVNVSARQLQQGDFVDQVLDLLASSGADPSRLKLEITESMLFDNVEQIIVKMGALKALGVGFSLDDFGTGYSSLSYLKRLPLDQLKIDQSFVRDVLTDPNDAAIVRTIVALAHSLGLAVIAEGVETAPQRDFLAAHGCHAYQGYLFGQPLPLAQFESLNLRRSSRAAARTGSR